MLVYAIHLGHFGLPNYTYISLFLMKPEYPYLPSPARPPQSGHLPRLHCSPDSSPLVGARFCQYLETYWFSYCPLTGPFINFKWSKSRHSINPPIHGCRDYRFGRTKGGLKQQKVNSRDYENYMLIQRYNVLNIQQIKINLVYETFDNNQQILSCPSCRK